MRYVIRPGDTLFLIAQRYSIALRDLLAANPGIDPARLMVGQVINVPTVDQPPGTAAYVVRPGDTFAAIAQRFNISQQALAAANPQVVNPAMIWPGETLYIPQRPNRTYVVQPGDTLWTIAQRYGISVAELQRANPGVDPARLMVGQRLSIPTAPAVPVPEGAIVVPREGYGYDAMMADLRALQARFPFIEVGSIGESVEGRSIPVVRIGTGPREVHFNGSFHAHEWITTPLLMRFLEVYADAFQRGQRIGQFDIPTLYRQSTLWLVPMVNPDGVELVQRGISRDNPYYDLVLRANQGSTDFRGWAANIRGVDLNNQFPAGWEREVARKPTVPSPRGYPGPSPLSEPESRAMAEFTRSRNFRMVLAYHSQGQVIFWGYEGLEPTESEQIVRVFADASGYQPIRYIDSWAGYKDWFIQDWRRPGFTVEVGRGVNPLPIEQFWTIWGNNIGILLSALAL